MRRPLRRRSGAGGDYRVLHRHGVTGFRGLLLRRRSGPGFVLCRLASGARSARRPARVVAVERLLHDAADELPHGHAGVHVREQPPQVLQSLLAVGVDDDLQLVAPVAERAHAVGRRRQFGVQVGQHPADLACALAGRLLDELPSSCRIEHQRRRRLGVARRCGRRGVRRRIVRPRSLGGGGPHRTARRCGARRRDRRGAGDRPAPPLPVERPLQLGSGAQRQRAVAQPLPRVRLVGAQPHGADAPPGGSVAVAELAHRVVEQAGAASLQVQAAGLDFGQVVDDGALQVALVVDQRAGLAQQLAVGEHTDGGGDRGADSGRMSGVLHGVNVLPVFK